MPSGEEPPPLQTLQVPRQCLDTRWRLNQHSHFINAGQRYHVKHGILGRDNGPRRWANTSLSSVPRYLLYHPLDTLPPLIPQMAVLAKCAFEHHLPLVTVPLCWNIFSSCKLNCPSGAIFHLMKVTPWHRTRNCLGDSFGSLRLWKEWTALVAPSFRTSLNVQDSSILDEHSAAPVPSIHSPLKDNKNIFLTMH